MAIAIGILLVIIVVFLLTRNSISSRNQNIETHVRDTWAKPKQSSFYFDMIARYANQKTNDDRLSNQTLRDIDFYKLFEFVDRTCSKPGQQYLFYKLVHPSQSLGALEDFDRGVEFFNQHPDVRKEVQKLLLSLDHFDSYYLSDLIDTPIQSRPAWLKHAWWSLGFAVVCIFASFWYPAMLAALIIPAAVNAIIHYWNKGNILNNEKSFRQLDQLINVVEKLTVVLRERPGASAPVNELQGLSKFRDNMWLLGRSSDGSLKDELAQLGTYLVELLKSFTLIEVFSFFRIAGLVESKRRSIQHLFDYVGEVDAQIATASLRSQCKTCKPTIISRSKACSIVNGYHPLIKGCVPNSLEINSRGVMITGSNMSGKTTFLRTLIINSVLGQSIFTCFADEFATPMLRQCSSIRIEDNVMEKKSYYVEEVNVIGQLVEESDSPSQNLFILDEVFKGTNTLERLALAKAILSYLNRSDNLVIVSTHDIELSSMLENEYDLYHFAETIENNDLYFDYELKPGLVKTRNAIRILQMANYPDAIIEEARKISDKMGKVMEGLRG